MSQSIETLNQIIKDMAERKVVQIYTEDEKLEGSKVKIEDHDLVNFGSCSYLGLEFHPALKQGTIDAVTNFGTQFSTSRTYLAVNLYDELEKELEKMFEKPLIATASTTLGHLATLPVIVGEDDAIILDLQVHSSVQMAAQLLKARKVPIYILPHNSMEDLESKVKALQNQYNKIWYMADGVYSMYGDTVPMDELTQLMDKYESLHVYIDDAHGFGWTGENGVGYVRSKVAHHDKMVLTISMCKSFAAAGGVVIFPNEEMRNKVKNCGSTLIFSGPIQPPMLGAALASARLHQKEELTKLQEDLRYKVDYVNRRLNELNLPQFCPSETPLFFVCVGLPRITYNIISRMKKKGFFLNSAVYPAVPMRKSGLRFMVNTNISIEEIDAMLSTLQKEYVLALKEEGSSVEEVARVFRMEPFEIQLENNTDEQRQQESLSGTLFRNIEDLDRAEWDALMAQEGCHTFDNIRQLQNVFSGHERKEFNTDLYFYKVSDHKNKTVVLSVFSSALAKDDMLAPADKSLQIEEIRKKDPYYLTSKQVMTGTLFSSGKSVYINEEHPQWKQGVELLLRKMQEVADQDGATGLMLRDFDALQAERFNTSMLELGLTQFQLPNQMVSDQFDWSTTEEFIQNVEENYREHIKGKVLALENQFEVVYDKPGTDDEKRACYHLYLEVLAHNLELNTFELPYSVFEMMFEDANYDIIRLYLNDTNELAGVSFGFKNNETYHGVVAGLNMDYVASHNTFEQLLYQVTLRARTLNCKKLDLAYTAESEKMKFGAKPQQGFAFVQATEHTHMSHAILESLN